MEVCCGFFGNAALREIFQIPTIYRQGNVVGKIEIGLVLIGLPTLGVGSVFRAPSCSVQKFVDVFHNVFKTAVYGGFDEFVLIELRLAIAVETVAKSCFFIEINLPFGVAAQGHSLRLSCVPGEPVARR